LGKAAGYARILGVKGTRWPGFWLAGAGLLMISLAMGCAGPAVETTSAPAAGEETMQLPEPKYDSNISLEKSLLERRSVRSYADAPLTLQEISQLFWAAQGITDPAGLRTAPSAGGTYPLEVYVVIGKVQDLDPGVYRYIPAGHKLVKTIDGDLREPLAEAALDQEWVKEGAVVFVFTAIYERTTGRYGERGIRYVHIELGHAAENLCLQATALGLGPVTVGAFEDDRVSKLLNLPVEETPLYIIPVGRK
jgi:SagB-type dehydrogenase family enzyme